MAPRTGCCGATLGGSGDSEGADGDSEGADGAELLDGEVGAAVTGLVACERRTADSRRRSTEWPRSANA